MAGQLVIIGAGGHGRVCADVAIAAADGVTVSGTPAIPVTARG